MKDLTLKSCPFCDGEAKTKMEVIKLDGNLATVLFTVFCKCGCYRAVSLQLKDTEFSSICNAMTDVVEKWNRRSGE